MISDLLSGKYYSFGAFSHKAQTALNHFLRGIVGDYIVERGILGQSIKGIRQQFLEIDKKA